MSAEVPPPRRRKGRWFAAYWERELRSKPPKVRAMREFTVGGARGRVLEVGCGPGGNFPLYAQAVTAITAIDAYPYMVERAQRQALKLGMSVDIREALAESLPFPDGSFDTVVSTFNFCSIGDPAAALAEVRRVLQPSGEYRFSDHVRYANRFGALCQDAITPIWSRVLNAGCHPNRDIETIVRAAGFTHVDVEHRTPFWPVPPMGLLRPHIVGTASR